MTDIFRPNKKRNAVFAGVGGDGEEDDACVNGASNTRVTVWLSGLRLARATGCGAPVPAGLPWERPAVSGAVVQACEHGAGTVELSQAAPRGRCTIA